MDFITAGPSVRGMPPVSAQPRLERQNAVMPEDKPAGIPKPPKKTPAPKGLTTSSRGGKRRRRRGGDDIYKTRKAQRREELEGVKSLGTTQKTITAFEKAREEGRSPTPTEGMGRRRKTRRRRTTRRR